MLLEEEPANWERAVPVYNSTISITQNEANQEFMQKPKKIVIIGVRYRSRMP